MTEPTAGDVTGPRSLGVGPDHVLLSEWAGRYPGAVPMLGQSLDRSPCPICGHPTGDCTVHLEDTRS